MVFLNNNKSVRLFFVGRARYLKPRNPVPLQWSPNLNPGLSRRRLCFLLHSDLDRWVISTARRTREPLGIQAVVTSGQCVLDLFISLKFSEE